MGRKVKRVLLLLPLLSVMSHQGKEVWIIRAHEFHTTLPAARIPLKSTFIQRDRFVFKLFLFSYLRDLGDMSCIITYMKDNEGYGSGFITDGKICHSLSKFLNP